MKSSLLYVVGGDRVDSAFPPNVLSRILLAVFKIYPIFILVFFYQAIVLSINL